MKSINIKLYGGDNELIQTERSVPNLLSDLDDWSYFSGLINSKQDNILEFTDVVVPSSSWEYNNRYNNFQFRATIPLQNVTSSMTPMLTFSLEDAESGNYSPIVETYDGGIYIWSKADYQIMIKSILCVPLGAYDTSYTSYENEFGGLTYSITSANYTIELNSAGGNTFTIGEGE